MTGKGTRLGASAPSGVSSDGRQATFLFPAFQVVGRPGHMWLLMTDLATGGVFHTQVYYTELCHDTAAWPDPTVESHICLSFDPDVASRCAYGLETHAKTARGMRVVRRQPRMANARLLERGGVES